MFSRDRDNTSITKDVAGGRRQGNTTIEDVAGDVELSFGARLRFRTGFVLLNAVVVLAQLVRLINNMDHRGIDFGDVLPWLTRNTG